MKRLKAKQSAKRIPTQAERQQLRIKQRVSMHIQQGPVREAEALSKARQQT
jgi:hypothetical protein